MADLISLSGVTRSFGRTRALDGLDLTVAAGEVHGFLGLAKMRHLTRTAVTAETDRPVPGSGWPDCGGGMLPKRLRAGLSFWT